MIIRLDNPPIEIEELISIMISLSFEFFLKKYIILYFSPLLRVAMMMLSVEILMMNVCSSMLCIDAVVRNRVAYA